MKNIIKIMKNITLNKRGSAKSNVIQGLSVAVFATVIIYGVYTSYNNSPAYNPARRAAFLADNQNLSINAFDSESIALQTADGISDDMRNEFGQINGFKNSAVRGGTSVKSRISKGEAEFESARAYMDAQKAAAANGAQAGVVDGTDYVLNGETNPMLTAQGGVRNSYNGKGAAVKGYNAGGAQTGQDVKDLEKVKNGKMHKSAGQRTPTVVNKLVSSSGSSSVASGAKSSGSGFSGSNFGDSVNYGGTKAGRDSSEQPLSSINLANAKDASAFKAGRGGTMGGHNVGYNVGNESGGEKGRGSDSKSDLNVAFAHSKRGAASVYKSGEKGTVEAAAAFDGSETSSGGEIGGDQVVNPSGDRDLGHGLHSGLNGFFSTFDDQTVSKTAQQENLIYAGTTHFMSALWTTLAAIYLICMMRRLAQGTGPYAWAWWIAIAAVAAASIYSIMGGVDYDGNGHNIWRDMGDLSKVNEDLNSDNGKSWGGWLRPILCVFTGFIGLAIAFGDKVSKGVNNLTNKVFGTPKGAASVTFASTKIGVAATSASMGKLLQNTKDILFKKKN